MFLFKRLPRPRPSVVPRVRPMVEQLETRLVPYALTGNAWPGPQVVTLSFIPDGTLVSSGSYGNVYSNMFATFNARWPTATWEGEILKAVQLWAQQANVNVTVVADNGTAAGQGNYQQGDPAMGDIRIGGFAMSSTYLGLGFMPPPANNYSIAGDIFFNTKQSFSVTGATYDLQTVAVHEFGHAFGLDHSIYGTVMYAYYTSSKRALSTDDTLGIQSIYGSRSPDIYDAVLPNNSFLTATPLTTLLDPVSLTSLVGNLDISTTSDLDYFTFVAPVGTSSTLTVNVQSSGLSLLRPTVTVYAADQTTILGSASGGAGSFNGATLSVSVSGVSAGQQFYVKVGGADTTAFGTGDYALSLNLGTGTMPSVSLPNTQLLNGTVFSGGGGEAEKHFDSIDPSDEALDFYEVSPPAAQDEPPGPNDHGGPAASHNPAAPLTGSAPPARIEITTSATVAPTGRWLVGMGLDGRENLGNHPDNGPSSNLSPRESDRPAGQTAAPLVLLLPGPTAAKGEVAPLSLTTGDSTASWPQSSDNEDQPSEDQPSEEQAQQEDKAASSQQASDSIFADLDDLDDAIEGW